MTLKIKFDRGQAKMLGLMTEAELPDAEAIKDMICACVFLGEDSFEENILAGLVKAYVAVLDDNLFEEYNDAEGVETVSYDCNFTAETIWLKYAVIGFLSGFPIKEAKKMRKEEEECPGTLYECITPYFFSKDINWPTQLLAELAYAMGYRDYRSAVQMKKFMENMREVEIVTTGSADL